MSKTKKHTHRLSGWQLSGYASGGVVAYRMCRDCDYEESLTEEQVARRLNAYERRERYRKATAADIEIYNKNGVRQTIENVQFLNLYVRKLPRRTR